MPKSAIAPRTCDDRRDDPRADAPDENTQAARARAGYLPRLVAPSSPRVHHLHAPPRYTILHLAAIEINVSHALDSICPPLVS